MIRAQRKIHFIAWILMAVFLPGGIVVAWRLVPPPARQKLLYPVPAGSLPVKDSSGLHFVRYDSVASPVSDRKNAAHE